jgi:hypothetical protein
VYTVVGFVRNMYWKLEDAKGADKTVIYDDMLKMGAAAPNPASKKPPPTKASVPVAAAAPTTKKTAASATTRQPLAAIKGATTLDPASTRQPLAAIKKERAVARVLTSVGIDAGNLVEGKRTRKAPMKLNL